MDFEIKDGSVNTLWRVSLPMILSFLSALGMITVDRLFLASYSAEALGAAASAGTSAWALTFGGQALTNIAGVFVAHHNGAKRYDQIGQPVWQMVWLSLLFCIPCAAAGMWLAPLLFQGSPIAAEQIEYYRWSMGVGPLVALSGALGGFFIGRGQTQVITWLTLLANLVNLVLDPLFIFGWGIIPSLGIAGACLATWIGMCIQVVILFCLFLRKEAREKYGTGNFCLKWTILWSCVRVGGPESIAAVLELSAWGMFYILLGNLSAIHILVASVGQSILMAVFWFGIGMEHGISSVAGNLMGRGAVSEVRRVFQSGLKIVGIFSIALFAVIFVGKDWIVDLFLKSPEDLKAMSILSSLSNEQINEARNYLLQSLFFMGVYLTLENIRSLLYGLLRAAGDTLFILILSVFSTWSLLLLPTYQFFTVWKMQVDVCFLVWLEYAAATSLICYLRFAKGKWNKRALFGDA